MGGMTTRFFSSIDLIFIGFNKLSKFFMVAPLMKKGKTEVNTFQRPNIPAEIFFSAGIF